MKKALIIGITGQDGSFLSELLLSKGYEVHGLLRRSSTVNTDRIETQKNDIKLHYGDLCDGSSVRRIIEEVAPDELYNLGAQSHVQHSFEIPEYTADVTAVGVTRVLDAIKGTRTHFYQAGTSELFGNAPAPQNEKTPFYPRSPYGAAKAYAYYMTVNYREAYRLFAANGILFNHESERRGEAFVTRKITRAVARIKYYFQEELVLGNTSALRDWGFAGDYVDAMWRMLQQDTPGDFVIGTGVVHSVQEFVEAAFGAAGLDWRKHVKTSDSLLRPAEVNCLRADPRKAKEQLGWSATMSFEDLVARMVDYDLALASKEMNQ